jgi:hypothetical protein
MKFSFGGHAVGLLVSLTLMGGLASGASVGPVAPGEFNTAGSVYITNTVLDFSYAANLPPGDQSTAIVKPETGPFTDLSVGQIATMSNLTVPTTATPGTPFNFVDWIVLPDGIDLDLQNIPINLSVPVCSGTSADDTPGVTCRPFASSAVVLTQAVTGVSAIMNLSGVAHNTTNSANFSGLLSANFSSNTADGTITGLLADFTSHGFITTSFSANFSTVAPAVIPEPGALAALGLGLLAAGVLKKRKSAK